MDLTNLAAHVNNVNLMNCLIVFVFLLVDDAIEVYWFKTFKIFVLRNIYSLFNTTYLWKS